MAYRISRYHSSVPRLTVHHAALLRRGTYQEEVAKLIDVTTCIGCKACQVACSEWNDIRDDSGAIASGFTITPPI
ncbi:hypothetical protein AB3H32_14705 [Escherichia coli]